MAAIKKGVNTQEATKLEILQFLLDGKERRGEEIVNAAESSKKTVYKYRVELVEDGMVEMLPVTPRATRPRYKITEKGRSYLFNQSAGILSLACQNFEQILKQLLKPESLDDLKKAHYETDQIFRDKLSSFDTSTSSFEEFAALSKETASSTLVSLLRQIYGLYVDVTGWGKEEATLIGFTEGGGFYLTPASKLIGGSIREGQDMSWRTVKAVFRLDQKRLREEKEKSQKQEGAS